MELVAEELDKCELFFMRLIRGTGRFAELNLRIHTRPPVKVMQTLVSVYDSLVAFMAQGDQCMTQCDRHH